MLMLKKVKSVIKNTFLFTNKLSLQKKLIFFNILLLAIPVTVFGLILMQSMKNNIENESLKSSQEAFERAITNIKRNTEICSNAIQMVINNKNFMSFIDSDEQDYSVDELLKFKSDALTNIQRILSINPDIYSIRFFTNNPSLFDMWNIIYKEENIQEESWYRDVLNQKGEYCWRFNEKYKNLIDKPIRKVPEEAVSLYIEISYPNDQHRGILEVSMPSDTFFSDFYDASNNDDSFFYMTNHKQISVSNTKGKFLSRLNWDIADLQIKLKEMTIGDKGSFNIKYNGSNLIVVYSQIKILDSYLYRISSVDMMMNELNTVRNYVLLGIIAGILALSLVTYLFTSILLKKLRIIIDSMRKVQDGDLNIDIPVHGNDEMGELAYHYRKMMVRIQKLIHVVVQKQTAFKDAELKALQSQINKHFIYNVLESINMLAESHHEHEISDIVTSLGRLMRYSMSWDRQYVTLEEELENVSTYINLVNARYGNIVHLVIDVDKSLYGIEVLKMLLQPITENSVKHGFEQKGSQGSIIIKAFADKKDLAIEIFDDGVGLEKEKLARLKIEIEPDSAGTDYKGGSMGIGLKNVNTRIKLFYGKEYGLDMDSIENEYTCVMIKLPLDINLEEGA